MMRDILICTVHQILLDDIRGDEVGGECITYGIDGERMRNEKQLI
jgi:hypothetical protein